MEPQVLFGTIPSSAPLWARLRRVGGALALSALLVPGLSAQVLTIDTSGRGPATNNGPVEKQYQQIEPTHVKLPNDPMTTRDRLQLVRVMQMEQGFAMRPLPQGHKGLTLQANGKLEPAGVPYLNMVISNGLSAKPGQRVVITNVKVNKNKLILDFNGGPDAKHRFLRHISIGMDPYDPYDDTPVVNDTGDPGGARITIAFEGHIPALTGAEVKALLAPLVTFDVKTPVQAYTDTLPLPLKNAILNHQVLVGMNTDMLMFAKGQPQTKYHEMEGQMPVDIWLYGKAPQPVTFVRINGNRVIRVEIARVGKPLQVFDKDVVSPMLMGTSAGAVLQAQNVRVIQEGDVHRNPDTQAPAPPPTLMKPGETAPDGNKSAGEMKPVHFPKQQPDNYPDASQGSAQPASAPASTAPANSGSAPGSAQDPSWPGETSPTGQGPNGQPPTGQGPDAQPGPVPPASQPN